MVSLLRWLVDYFIKIRGEKESVIIYWNSCKFIWLTTIYKPCNIMFFFVFFYLKFRCIDIRIFDLPQHLRSKKSLHELWIYSDLKHKTQSKSWRRRKHYVTNKTFQAKFVRMTVHFFYRTTKPLTYSSTHANRLLSLWILIFAHFLNVKSMTSYLLIGIEILT